MTSQDQSANPSTGFGSGLTDPDNDGADLTGSLAGLAGLHSHASLETNLTQIAGLATQAIPGADGAGLTLLEPDRSDIVVKSEAFVVQVDDIQYSLGQGPCIDAVAQGRTIRSGSLSGDPRWPRFGPRVGRLGVHSALSLPLITPTGLVGAMNIYAHAEDAFDEQAERIGEMFAGPAAISVQNAQFLAHTQRLTTHLQAALSNRPAIDQAIGILRARGGISADEALTRLRRISQHEHRTLHEVAESMIEEAVNRARHRSAPPAPPSN